MKTSTVLLTMLPTNLLVVLILLLPKKYVDYGLGIFLVYLGVLFIILAKYILRGDNAHLISGVNISYEEAKLPENIEKYARTSKINGMILLISSFGLIGFGIYLILSNIF